MIAESLFKRLRRTDAIAPPSPDEDVKLVPLKPGHRFPDSEGRPFTPEEFERALEEGKLP